jgi:hypothetical protein
MSNNKKQNKMENFNTNNGNLENWEIKNISLYKRGVAGIIKKYPQYAIKLNAVVAECLEVAGTIDWYELTGVSAMNINIAVQNELGALKPILDTRTPEEKKASEEKAIGAYLEGLRATGTNSGLD